MVEMLVIGRIASAVMIAVVLGRLADNIRAGFSPSPGPRDLFYIVFGVLMVSRGLYELRNVLFHNVADEPGELAYLLLCNVIGIIAMGLILFAWHAYERPSK